MLEKLTEYMFVKMIEKKLRQYDIRMLHFIPGRIRLQSPRWIKDFDLVGKIVSALQAQTLVFSVQPTAVTGSLVITYDANHVTNIQELESWFQMIDRVYTTDYVK